MANVIDIIIAAKDQASAAIARVQGSLGGLNTVLGAFSPALAVGGITSLGAAAAGAVLAVKSLASEAEHLSNAAQQTGVSVDAIQTVSVAFEKAGLSSEDATQALKFLNRAIAEGNPLLDQFGVTSKDAYTAFLQLADAFRAHADDPNKVNVALQLLGRAGNVAIPILNQGSGALRAVGQEARDLGAILSTETIGKLNDADKAFDNFALAVKGLKNEIGAGLADPMTKTVNAMTEFFKFFRAPPAIKKGDYVAVLRGDQWVIVPKEEVLVGPPIPGPPPTPGPPSALDTLLGRGIGPPALPGTKGFRADMKLKPDSLLDVPVTVLDSKTAALNGFKTAMDDITDAGTVMADSLHLAFDALQMGFKGIFDSIVAGGRGFADALRGLFRGLVDAILAELARLAAAALFRVLLSFIIPGVSAGGSTFIGPPAPAGTRSGPAPDLRSTGNTYVINAIDARDVVMQLMSPGGSMRRANDRIAIAGAY